MPNPNATPLFPNFDRPTPAPEPPPDQPARSRALDPTQSFLVQAPAGSGKTYLLTQRFLRLLARAEKPEEIVAITFTKAAAAEMRQRILENLEKAEQADAPPEDADPESLPVLAWEALERGRVLDWQLLDQPSQLRITTIDALCRTLALQCPLQWGLLSSLGGRLDSAAHPKDLYRRAATRTLEAIQHPEQSAQPARAAVEALLQVRDNNWKDIEDLLVKMLTDRNRWFQDFVFTHNQATEADWTRLRKRLESPFCRAAKQKLNHFARILDRLPGCREYALELARVACQECGPKSPTQLAERAELPAIFEAIEEIEESLMLEDALEGHRHLAAFLLTQGGTWRKRAGLNVSNGFPPTPQGNHGKNRFEELVNGMAEEPGLDLALFAFSKPMPTRYTEEEWQLVRNSFTVLSFAAAQLQVVFSETSQVDFTEVAQIAQRVLLAEDGTPSDFALRVSDGIHHLLVDEFQDTSRNQHQLLKNIVNAWPDRSFRTLFCVGDPMQSIYSFREAEVELFERLKTHGLEAAEPLHLEPIALTANFRTVPTLVEDLNHHFHSIFAENDSSGVTFYPSQPARQSPSTATTAIHSAFTSKSKSLNPQHSTDDPAATRQDQLAEIVTLIRHRLESAAANAIHPYRIAVLARTRPSLTLIAEALHQSGIPYRAVDLVSLRERPEILDALALTHALLNPVDRTAWLAVLRAPWSGLSLAELHHLTSADDPQIANQPIPILLERRLPQLQQSTHITAHAFMSAERVNRVLKTANQQRPAASTLSLGTWVESVWKALGGESTLNRQQDREQLENLRLLWQCLDALPDGEVGLLGPSLGSALADLKAQPNPAVSPDFGVQLMTIHHSKGLEFEVVIVPDLESEARKNEPDLLSWLERGLSGQKSDPESGQDQPLTEFLIAPIQPKGADAGAAKRWVDSERRTRETQEQRRLLYVAATRAREELHLFARPRYNEPGKSSPAPTLATPTGLLATAWPAFSATIEARFAEWLEETRQAETTTIPALAAEFTENLLEMPQPTRPNRPTRPTLVRRLPQDFTPPDFSLNLGSRNSANSTPESAAEESAPVFARTEGGLHSRLLGIAIHTLLEHFIHLSRNRETQPPRAALLSLNGLNDKLPRLTAALRAKGLTAQTAQNITKEALRIMQQVAADPTGLWIAEPHPQSQTESLWTGSVRNEDGRESLRNFRPDRIFLAPPPSFLSLGAAAPPAAATAPLWWIIDFKTSHSGGRNLDDPNTPADRQTYLTTHRLQHQGQLAAYAQILRSLYLADAPLQIRAGIYYPRLLLFDHWQA